MQSENFDNKVREAADHHHPAYDEKAWGKMEKLLDKHLPQKDDDRKRIIFFLLLFLLLGGGAWLLISKPWKENKQMASVKPAVEKPAVATYIPVSPKQEDPKENNDELNKAKDVIAVVTGDDQRIKMPGLPTTAQSNVNKDRINKKDPITNRLLTSLTGKKMIKADPVTSASMGMKPADMDNKDNRKDNNPVDAVKANTAAVAVVADQKNKEPVPDGHSRVINNTTNAITEPANKEKENKDNTALLQNPSTKKIKNKEKKTNSFFLLLSAGPDFSFAGGDKPGSAKLLTGGGMGFTFKDRLTLKTGFYTGRKVYTASPGSYHPPASFWSYYPYLQKVDADCKVYEIPLSLSYNFGLSSKQQWFASAGLSSLLMKRETYNYFYKNIPSGPTEKREWTIYDQNKHYFSVLTLSGGYQKNFGKIVSVTVEPYLKLPLSGIGYGKVKLNSGGVLFSVGIKPFNKSKAHNNSLH